MSRIVWKNCKQIAAVYETSDYGMFREMEHNRDVSSGRVDKLVASFSEREILNPIVVNEKAEIADGQGRYEALKILGRPIKFLVSEGATIDDCRRMNLYNTKWELQDFIDSYAKAGNQNYIMIKNCKEKYGIPYSRVLRLANHGRRSDSTHPELRSGRLVFTKDDYDVVSNVIEKVNDIRKALVFNERLNDAFYTAVKVVVETEGYDHDRMLKKCLQERTTFNQMSKLEAQLKEFSRIYNARSRGAKGNLYFEDYMRNKGYNVRTYENIFIEKNSENAKTLKKS